MNLSAIRHLGNFPDLYLKDRRTLVFTVHTANDEIQSCELIWFPRTDIQNRNYVKMERYLRDRQQDHFCAVVEFEDTAHYLKYFFRIIDLNGGVYFLNAWEVSNQEPKDGYYEFLYANETDVLIIPEWIKGQVYYQIFPERFFNGDLKNDPQNCQPWGTKPTRENYMGGDLKGIIEKVGYLDMLGVDCIYLNPIFKADFNHKYATTDYLEIDEQFGTKEDFKKLVDKLHEYGIKIILDGVFNHCGTHFPAFQDVLQKQQESEYKNWFYIRSFPVVVSEQNAPYECVGDYGYMPKLNTANPLVQEYIEMVMLYWISEFHIDGWRLDVADEVDPSLWLRIRQDIKRKYPQILLLGETWGNGLGLMDGKQMDSIMNYVFRDAVRDFFGFEKIDAVEFNHRISAMLSHYPEEMNIGMFLVLDSHDTERFLFYCDGNKEKLKLAVLFQMCFVGAPSIYYGDEIGMTGENDPDCRRCMQWDTKNQEQKLLQHYLKMIQIRKREKCIKTGRFAVNVCERRVFGFVRFDENEEIYVVCNAGNERQSVDVPVLSEGEFDELTGSGVYRALKMEKELLNSTDVLQYDGILRLDLGAYEGLILKRRKNL